ncbi:MAG TPA: MIP/aquaporin family protein [Pyrinomonadaceae bacterium]|nr:MIP/aquaporin family protein [Pyrinomonadaceae bacterium]
MFNLYQRLAAEFIGTAGLLAAVVGSGIMAERLAGGNAAVALLANTIATGAALFVLILSLAQVSGAHFNPAVTLTQLLDKQITLRAAAGYLAVQFWGAACGVALANAMFDLPLVFASQRVRTGGGQWLSEFIATFGLILVISATARLRSVLAVPLGVAAYISAAYWFTASTSFANPAVTAARALSDSFAGIRPADVPAFILFQMAGAVTAAYLARWLFSVAAETTDDL